ncbi:hypothetical protein D5R81_17090 [Parashewanella spongiae]|uniref:Uncharacterized protein n=1 Tax=Parashewanella spongiae TaxID=342950 RepID=A0A3A6TEK5_9GAMM|nr:hypothetical protein D5R81_17090 [Parashewanella spongiae]
MAFRVPYFFGAHASAECKIEIPEEFMNLTLVDSAIANNHQAIEIDNIIFTDTDKVKGYTYNYKNNVLNNLSFCKVTNSHHVTGDSHFRGNDEITTWSCVYITHSRGLL